MSIKYYLLFIICIVITFQWEHPIIRRVIVKKAFRKNLNKKNLIKQIKKLRVSNKLIKWLSKIKDFKEEKTFENFRIIYNHTKGGISKSEISILKEKKISKIIKGKKKLINIIELTYGSGNIFLKKNYLTKEEERCHHYLYFFQFCWNNTIPLPFLGNLTRISIKSFKNHMLKKINSKKKLKQRKKKKENITKKEKEKNDIDNLL